MFLIDQALLTSVGLFLRIGLPILHLQGVQSVKDHVTREWMAFWELHVVWETMETRPSRNVWSLNRIQHLSLSTSTHSSLSSLLMECGKCSLNMRPLHYLLRSVPIIVSLFCNGSTCNISHLSVKYTRPLRFLFLWIRQDFYWYIVFFWP